MGINSSTLSGKTIFMKQNTYIQDTFVMCVYSHKRSRIDPRNILPRKEELLRFMVETDFLVSFCLKTILMKVPPEIIPARSKTVTLGNLSPH